MHQSLDFPPLSLESAQKRQCLNRKIREDYLKKVNIKVTSDKGAVRYLHMGCVEKEFHPKITEIPCKIAYENPAPEHNSSLTHVYNQMNYYLPCKGKQMQEESVNIRLTANNSRSTDVTQTDKKVIAPDSRCYQDGDCECSDTFSLRSGIDPKYLRRDGNTGKANDSFQKNADYPQSFSHEKKLPVVAPCRHAGSGDKNSKPSTKCCEMWKTGGDVFRSGGSNLDSAAQCHECPISTWRSSRSEGSSLGRTLTDLEHAEEDQETSYDDKCIPERLARFEGICGFSLPLKPKTMRWCNIGNVVFIRPLSQMEHKCFC